MSWRSLSDLVDQAKAEVAPKIEVVEGPHRGSSGRFGISLSAGDSVEGPSAIDEDVDPAVNAYLEQRVPDHDELFGDPLSRRRFMQIMGASIALSSAGLQACRWEEDHLVPESQRPEGYVPGVPKKYATAMELGGVAYGLVATAYDGRPIKVDGNVEHPHTGRGSTAFVQASLLDLYDPDRSRALERREGTSPLPATWSSFESAVSALVKQLGTTGRGFRVLSEATSSPTIAALRKDLLARFPEARWHEWEPLSRDNERAGTRMAFGRPMRPHLKLAEARVIATFDADLFGDHPESLRLARDYATGRDPDENPSGMNRHYAVESAFSITGAGADHRLPLRSEQIKPFLLALEGKLGGAGAAPSSGFDAKAQKFLNVLASDLTENRARAVIAVGSRQPPDVHALAARINAALGGDTVIGYSAEPDADRPTHIEDIAALAGDMQKGSVTALLIVGGNPVYDAPADLKFGAALAKVGTSVHLSYYSDETSKACSWHLPRAHYLEAWGDARTYDGTITLAQPILEPLFGGRSAIDVVKLFLGKADTPSQQLVREAFDAAGVAGASGDSGWRRALHDGFVAGSAASMETAAVQGFALAPPSATEGKDKIGNGSLEVVFTVNTATYDGRYANNAWMQEVPDFMTKMTWDNAAMISPRTAAQLGVAHEEIVTISLAGQKVNVVVYVMPGQAPGSIALAVGQGRKRAGKVGGHEEQKVDTVGFDTYALRSSKAPFVATGASVKGTGEKYRLSLTVDHYKMDELGEAAVQKRIEELAMETTAVEYGKSDYNIAANAHAEDVAALMVPAEADKTNGSLFVEHKYDGHRWGMTTDLSKCSGCNACIIACQAENNVPVVGKEQVWRNREMHWLRIDRYFQGDPDDPKIARLPVLCQQCENAPCEQVCPVGATLHSDEGLNDMAYNRCVGTRYCLNNCPYRVRRFNFLRWDWYEEIDDPRAKVRGLLFNPEVTVRSRGVMEKCTFCVQRIQNVKIQAKNAGRPITDGEITTACQDACPTGAIVFGDINDKNSKVAALRQRKRAYNMLAELNTRPRNAFLARVRNPHPELG